MPPPSAAAPAALGVKRAERQRLTTTWRVLQAIQILLVVPSAFDIFTDALRLPGLIRAVMLLGGTLVGMGSGRFRPKIESLDKEIAAIEAQPPPA